MSTVNNIPEKHLHKTSRENYCETVKIINAGTKIYIFINNLYFILKIFYLMFFYVINEVNIFALHILLLQSFLLAPIGNATNTKIF